MNRKFTITANKTFASEANADKAVAKTGDEGLRHFMMQTPEGRWFPVFPVNDKIMTETGIHFRWTCVS